MAEKEIIWSARALQDRIDILEYWILRNKSKAYSEKLDRLFISAVELLAEHPEIGKPTSQSGVRIKIVRDYLIIYRIKLQRIEILSIWDSRQNPEKLKKIIEED